MRDNITIIIRSAGERTTEFCKFLIEQQIHDDNIFIIKESPFSAAIKKGFEIGIKEAKKWTLCIDADVLVRKGVIDDLIADAESSDNNIFEFQGLILDKFFPIKRPAGNHLYRTSLIEEAIQCIPEEGSSLRPETDMLNAMIEKGYPWKQTDIIFGIHDFKQNYSDIYRKCFLQAHKHSYFFHDAEIYWNSKKEFDFDFQVALWGGRSGKVYNNTIYVDKNFLLEETNDVLSIMGTNEKKKIIESEFDVSFVEDALSEYNKNTQLFSNLQQRMFPAKLWVTTYQMPPGSNNSLLKKSILFLGKVLERLGREIKFIADKMS